VWRVAIGGGNYPGEALKMTKGARYIKFGRLGHLDGLGAFF
jgi:hypothetical protein